MTKSGAGNKDCPRFLETKKKSDGVSILLNVNHIAWVLPQSAVEKTSFIAIDDWKTYFIIEMAYEDVVAFLRG